MAKLDGTLENKTIVFAENDLVLNTWRLQVSSTNPRSLSLLIKAALRHYIRTNTCCCVGKVCIKNPKAEAMKKHTVCMSLSNSPDIIEWLRESKRIGVSQVVMIKSVLVRSIEVVDDESLEWIPSPIEIIAIANQGQGSMYPENISSKLAGSVRSLAGKDPYSAVHPGQPAVNTSEPVRESRKTLTTEAVPEPNHSKQLVEEKKKKPRAAALRGMHFK